MAKYVHATTVGEEAKAQGLKGVVIKVPTALSIPYPSESENWELITVIPITKYPGYLQYFWKRATENN